MDLSRIFVYNLRKWRRATGLSQKKLAEKCGAAHSYIRQIENGLGNPSFALLAKIAEALEIEPYQLFYDEDANPGKPARERQLESAKAKLTDEVSRTIQIAFDKLKNAL